jgi:hypothetical protein
MSFFLATRIVRATFLGTALYALVFRNLPSAGAATLCILAAMALVGTVGAPPSRPARPWLVALVILALGAAFAAIAYGALATPSRFWDGVAAWDPKAAFLAAQPNLDQPFFRDPAVFLHSRDYPLLQPQLMAALERLLGIGSGRTFFPFLYLLAVTLVGTSLRQKGLPSWLCWVGALAFGLTPMLVNPTSGGADSGYAELLLCACTTAMAAGLFLRSPLLLLCGGALAVLGKPEGLVYAALPVVITWCRGERALLRGALPGLLLGAFVLLPQQYQLEHGERMTFAHLLWLLAGLVVLAGIVLGSDAWLARRSTSTRTRWLGALLGGPLLCLVLPLCSRAFGGEFSAMGQYLGEPLRFLQRLPLLPKICGGMVEYGILRLAFGAAFLLPLVAGIVLRWSKRRPLPDAGLSLFLGLGLCAVAAAFLLSPEDDLSHHLKSSMPRLLLHWLGAAWLLGVSWTHAVGGEAEAASRSG